MSAPTDDDMAKHPRVTRSWPRDSPDCPYSGEAMRYGLLVLVLWVLFLVGTVLGLGGREMLVLGGIFGAMGVTVATVCWLDAREQRGLR